MIDQAPELPERIRKAAIPVKIKDGRTEYAWRYRNAVIVVIHIKLSGLLVTSVQLVDESTQNKVIEGWTNRFRSTGYEVAEIDDAHHQAINFITRCFDRAGDKYLYVIKCAKPTTAPSDKQCLPGCGADR